MMKQLKVVSVLMLGLFLTNCAGNYKIKKESGGNVVDSVPSWYMADISESKAATRQFLVKTKIKFVSTA
jgi:hypothetical protein